MADLRLYNERTGQYIDALYAVLVVSDEMQLFPEMLEIFGKDSVVKFLDVFAGQTITVPPVDVLAAKIRDVTIWLEVSKRGGSERIPELAREHGMTESQVRAKVAEVSECLSRVGVKACKSAKSASDHSGQST